MIEEEKEFCPVNNVFAMTLLSHIVVEFKSHLIHY